MTDGNSISNQSGGVDIDGQSVSIGGDVIGRDKITQTTDTGGGANISGNVTIAGGSEFAGRDIFKIINNIFTGTSEEVRDRRKKLLLLERVKKFWVEGVLEKSLHNGVLIELGKETRPDAVRRPWDIVLEEPCSLPNGQSISEIFGQMNHALLILGAPGAGKTLALLQLAKEMILQAEQYPQQPVPVVFNLSPWTKERLPLEDWLEEELNTRYGIPSEVGKKWIENDELVLLLDGLDEVAPESQASCVDAINQFRKKHGLAFMAVCSRTGDYDKLITKLALHNAILLQPLTTTQVMQYLESCGSQMETLLTLLKNNTDWSAFAQTPLMLGIMMKLDWRAQSAKETEQDISPESLGRSLFARYTQHMLQGNRAYPYSRSQSYRWLHLMAKLIIRRSDPIFHSYDVSINWVTRDKSWCAYRLIAWLAPRLFIGTGTFVFFMTILTFVVLLIPVTITFQGVLDMTLWAIGLGAIFLVVRLITHKSHIDLREPTIPINGSDSVEFLTVPAGCALYSLLTGLAIIVMFYLPVSLIVAAIVYVLGELGVAVRMTSSITDFVMVAIRFGIGMYGVGMIFGVPVALSTGLEVMLNDPSVKSPSPVVIRGAAFDHAIVSVVFGLVLGLFDVAVSSNPVYLGIGILFGAILAFLTGGVAGGVYFAQYFALRILSILNGKMPWNYARFLNQMASRGLLRKIGDGYIFIHRYLMEYFASLEPEAQKNA